MALALPERGNHFRRRVEAERTAHLVRHQEADGSWAWSSAPVQNRPPPVFESDEVATLLAYAAWPTSPADDAQKSDVRHARTRAAKWLARSKPTDTTQALGVGLLVQSLAHKADKSIQAEIDSFLARQTRMAAGDRPRTCRAMRTPPARRYVLASLAEARQQSGEAWRGVFVVATQKDDGSWPMTPRCHGGAKPAKNITPITYFGHAPGRHWDSLRSVAKSGPCSDWKHACRQEGVGPDGPLPREGKLVTSRISAGIGSIWAGIEPKRS